MDYLPLFFQDYTNYNARDEIFNAIENLSTGFAGVEFSQLCFSVYCHYQHPSTDKVNERNITERELMIIRTKLREAIARIRIDLDVTKDLFYFDRPSKYTVTSKKIRMVLSGMTLFRSELLPLFLNLILDKADKDYLTNAPIFISRHEENLKTDLFRYIREGKDRGDIEENIKMTPTNHLWWNKKKFIEMRNDVAVVSENSLHD